MKLKLTILTAVVIMALAGCSSENANQTTNTAGQKTANAANTTVNRNSETANAISNKNTESSNSVGAAISDTAITAKIKTKLLADGIAGTNVDTVNGVVTLKGAVDNAEEKTKAEKIAKDTDGVKSVKNELTIEKKK
ncbi:MAG: BON domain-containing protein [Acidobacteria bacterium]|nr:BON domain-containing protein [Acidobacteriota bacterium]